MSSLLAGNLDRLRARYGFAPALPQKVDNESARVSRRGPAPLLELRSGDGRWLRAHSAHDPLAEAAAHLDALTSNEPQTLFVVGIGLGHMLRDLERRAWSTKVVAVEPDGVLARLFLESADWRPWIDSGRLAILTGPEFGGAAAVARRLTSADPLKLVVHPVLERVHRDEVRAARDVVSRIAFEVAANDDARREHAGRYLLQTLANAPRLARESDVANLSGVFDGVPAIIAGAGPSLDANLHDTSLVADRAVVIACDTAARPLLSAGITPHLVVALDPSAANACHLVGLQSPSTTWLAAEASLHPSAFADFTGRTFAFRVADHQPWPWLAEAGVDRGQLDVWGSVLTAAVDLAIRMGCSPIVLVGADLAFTGGRPYCRGTIFEAKWATWRAAGIAEDTIWQQALAKWTPATEPDVHGAPTSTAPHLVAFRNWIVDRVGAATDRLVINGTGGGILHGGAIVPANVAHSLATYPMLSADDLSRRLRSAHRVDPAASARLFAAVDDVLTDDDHPRIREWQSFTDRTTARDEIRAALSGPEHRAWTLGKSCRNEGHS